MRRSILFVGITGTVFVLPVFALYVQSEPDNKTSNPEPEGTYSGQIPPGEIAEAFAPDVPVHEAHVKRNNISCDTLK